MNSEMQDYDIENNFDWFNEQIIGAKNEMENGYQLSLKNINKLFQFGIKIKLDDREYWDLIFYNLLEKLKD